MKPASVPPNVLLVIADDHRADALGAMGHACVRTPALDRLAARGAVCTRAYQMGGLTPAICSPARACLLTGTHLFAADAEAALGGKSRHAVAIAPRRPTLPEWFRRAGYETFLTGKWHNDHAALRRSFDRGRRVFLGGMSDHRRVPLYDYDPRVKFPAASPRFEAGFSTDLFCGAAAEFLLRRKKDRPFFAYVALTSPHDPRTPPAAYARRYPAGKMPLPANFLPQHPFDNGELDIRDELLLPKPLQPAALKKELGRYYGMITHQDARIGGLLAALERSGEGERTLVVYVSDHGLALGSHGLLGKQNLYEPSVRVPLLLCGPGVPAGRRVESLAYSFDLFPTLCELAGLPAPAGIAGRSLVPALRRRRHRPRRTVFSLYLDRQRMVCDGRWKLINYEVSGRRRHQLFDLKNDPDECRDLSRHSGRRAVTARLRAAMADWQRTIGDRWMLPSPAEGHFAAEPEPQLQSKRWRKGRLPAR